MKTRLKIATHPRLIGLVICCIFRFNKNKNSQLLSPERIKDIYETGNPYNHMIAQKKENASKNLNIVYAYGGRCWKGC